MNWPANNSDSTVKVHFIGPQTGRSANGATDWSAEHTKVYSFGPQNHEAPKAAYVAQSALTRRFDWPEKLQAVLAQWTE